ncbi:hypothetical protein NERG_02374 [Nematocida ausubeli]|uniref:Uncharacterized protein n=1 Tax=Nematocida ausubeli (strain ATCC PRA-371 / ERTm2) TaxID=1913371 RepID=H8ZFK3_NEMA1|nr:hypothetical protein NERG_02374 [Nematocida ausubeli]
MKYLTVISVCLYFITVIYEVFMDYLFILVMTRLLAPFINLLNFFLLFINLIRCNALIQYTN